MIPATMGRWGYFLIFLKTFENSSDRNRNQKTITCDKFLTTVQLLNQIKMAY